MDYNELNYDKLFDKNIDIDTGMDSIINTLVTQIVNENDKHTYEIIEDYVKNKQLEGEIISSVIIPEGRLRHVINLGLTRLNNLEHFNLKPGDLFPQEQYIEYLKRELMLSQQTINNLQKQVEMLQKMSGILSTDTIIEEDNESEKF